MIDRLSRIAIVFAGPSLPPGSRAADPAIEWRPPVREGDVDIAVQERPGVIGIIDGVFEVTPTVWHNEILRAMAHGIRVYGAASIGALRAVELHRFGMIGVGRIYEMFRDGVLEDDDEVAVVHGPEELGYPALSEAMVNIRATLAAAISAGILEPDFAAHLVATAKFLFYKERNWNAVLRAAAAPARYSTALEGFAAWLPGGRIDQKRADALEMIAALRAHFAAAVAPLRSQADFTTAAISPPLQEDLRQASGAGAAED